jgi:hypothetical protein
VSAVGFCALFSHILGYNDGAWIRATISCGGSHHHRPLNKSSQ